MKFILTITLLVVTSFLYADDAPLDVWPDLAPGETTRSTGGKLPSSKSMPPITRMEKVTQPTFTVHPAAKPNGTGVVILPGGGFGRVVPDLEGSAAADFLNRMGVTVFGLSNRTKNNPHESGWEKPLQDAQRTLAIVRSRAAGAERHVYGNGGHGYGVRPRANSEISSWPGHATHCGGFIDKHWFFWFNIGGSSHSQESPLPGIIVSCARDTPFDDAQDRVSRWWNCLQ